MAISWFRAKSKKDLSLDEHKKVILNSETSFSIREAYKKIRTNIMFSTAQETGCKVIIISSALPGEGKSTTGINIASTFAQTNEKILLIDADLRRPRLCDYLEVPEGEGLANILGGFTELGKCVGHAQALGFDYILAGNIPPNPAELLTSKKMSEVLESLKEKYDYIFIDTPPINMVTDVTTMLPLVSGVIMVVREGYSTYDEVEKALAALSFADAKIFGFILNDDKDGGRKKGSGYHYRKKGYGGYGYYYEYRHKDTERKSKKGNE